MIWSWRSFLLLTRFIPKKIEQIIQETNDSISDEISRTTKIGGVILFIIAIFFGIKVALKKYIEDDDRHYTTNKLVNFLLIVVIVFVVLFSYIENVSYLVTILGFASAGIAIALKDLVYVAFWLDGHHGKRYDKRR